MKLTLTIPDDQYERLEALSKNVPKYLGDRLSYLEDLDLKQPPFTIPPDQLREIQTTLGVVLKSPAQLVEVLRASQTIRLGDGVEVELPADDLYALQQQAVGMGAPSFEEYIKEFVVESINYQLYGAFGSRR